MLVKLEAKGVIRHRAEGPALRLPPDHVARHGPEDARCRSLMRVFFGGSPSEAAAALLKQEDWTDDELAKLRSEIDRVRKNRRQS